MPKMNVNKRGVFKIFRVDNETVTALESLSRDQRRSQSEILRQLVKDAYHTSGAKLGVIGRPILRAVVGVPNDQST